MFGSRPSRRLVGLIALLLLGLSAATATAQSSPVRVVQSSDGTLYLAQGSNAWTIVPNPISDTDLAGLIQSGELDGAIPAPFLGAPGAPSVLQVVQTDGGTLYVAQGGNAWTLVPAPISDADLAALTIAGELDGEISSPSLSAPGAPAAAASPNAVSEQAAPPAATPTVAPAAAQSGSSDFAAPWGVAIDPAGGLYITSGLRVLHFSASTTHDRTYNNDISMLSPPLACPPGLPPGPACSNGGLTGVAPDPAGGLYVADPGDNRVLHFSGTSTTPDRVYGQNGSLTSYSANSSSSAINAMTLSYPENVAVDPAGGLYVADTDNNRLLHFSGANTTADRVYGQNGSFTTSSAFSPRFSGTVTNTAASLAHPGAVAVDPVGGLFVADTAVSGNLGTTGVRNGGNRVLHFSGTSTVADRVYGQNGDFSTGDSSAADTGLSSPQGVAVDPAGGLYVADLGNGRVLHFSGTNTTPDRVYGVSGAFTIQGKIGGMGFQYDYLAGPTSVAADPAGGLYVAAGNVKLLHFSGTSTKPDRAYGWDSYEIQ